MPDILVWKIHPVNKRPLLTDDVDEAVRELRALLERDPSNTVIVAGVRMTRDHFNALPAFTGYEKGAPS